MGDFSDALNNALLAAETLDANMKEIRAVFQELRGAVEAISAGAVSLEIVPVRRRKGMYSLDAYARAAASALAALYAPEGDYTEHIEVNLFSRKEKTRSTEYVCDVEYAEFGYPVGIKMSGATTLCSTAQDLRDHLSTIMSRPAVGKSIRKLMAWSGGAV